MPCLGAVSISRSAIQSWFKKIKCECPYVSTWKVFCNSGMIESIIFCPMCGGSGSQTKQWCSACGGSELVLEKKLIKVRVPPGQTLHILSVPNFPLFDPFHIKYFFLSYLRGCGNASKNHKTSSASGFSQSMHLGTRNNNWCFIILVSLENHYVLPWISWTVSKCIRHNSLNADIAFNWCREVLLLFIWFQKISRKNIALQRAFGHSQVLELILLYWQYWQLSKFKPTSVFFFWWIISLQESDWPGKFALCGFRGQQGKNKPFRCGKTMPM